MPDERDSASLDGERGADDRLWLARAGPAVLDALLANGPLVVFWTSADPMEGSPAWADYISPNTQSVLGYPREAIGGRGFWLSRVHPDDQALVVGTRQEAIAHNRWPTRISYRFRHGDGDYRWIESTANLLPGPPARFLGFVSDVTEGYTAQAALHERERQLTAMFDGAPAQIFAKDLDGRYVLCNQAMLDVWGLASEDVIGRRDRDLWPEFADDYEVNDRHVAEADVPIVADEVVTIDGDLHTYLSLKFPLRDDANTVYGTAGVAADITDRARDMRELRVAKETAERANLAKSEFLSRMSHELRTPLNAILGFAQLLEMGELDEDENDSVNQILRAGRHLLDLINEVLDIARIEAGRLSLSVEPVSVDEMIGEAATLVAPSAGDRSITLTVEPAGADCFVSADRQRMLQVLLNLLSNAIKYNREGGSVVVRAEPRADGGTRIEVVDSGRGIAAEHHDAVFDVFERLGADASAVEGTGVGLALSRHLVELMGGHIGLTSEVGAGSTFWIDLQPAPASPSNEAEPAPVVDGGATESSAVTVLCIEDNLANLALFERVFATRPGVRLITAIQGQLGIELARQHQPELILLDLHLPDTTGIDVLHRLRNDPRTQSLHVVVLSADATPRQQARVVAAGANGYLTKPMDIRELLSIVDSRRPPKARA